MPIVSLPKRAAIHQAVGSIHTADALHPNGDTVFLAFADIPAMDVLAFLGAWGCPPTMKLAGRRQARWPVG